MLDLPLAHEPTVRLGAFLGVFGVMALWELVSPRRRPNVARWLRWSNNVTVLAVSTILVRVLFPVLAIELSLVAVERGWGLFNVVAVPAWVAFVASLVLQPFDVVGVGVHHIVCLRMQYSRQRQQATWPDARGNVWRQLDQGSGQYVGEHHVKDRRGQLFW